MILMAGTTSVKNFPLSQPILRVLQIGLSPSGLQPIFVLLLGIRNYLR